MRKTPRIPAQDEYLRLLEENVQEDNCGEEESEVDIVMEAAGREGEGVMLHEDKKSNARKIAGTSRS